MKMSNKIKRVAISIDNYNVAEFEDWYFGIYGAPVPWDTWTPPAELLAAGDKTPSMAVNGSRHEYVKVNPPFPESRKALDHDPALNAFVTFATWFDKEYPDSTLNFYDTPCRGTSLLVAVDQYFKLDHEKMTEERERHKKLQEHWQKKAGSK